MNHILAFVITMVLVYGICKAMNLKPSKESALICFAGCCAGVTPSSFLYNPGYVSLMETAIQNYIPDYKMGILDMPQYLWGLILCCVIMLFVLTKLYGAKDMKFEGGKFIYDAVCDGRRAFDSFRKCCVTAWNEPRGGLYDSGIYVRSRFSAA